MRYSPSHLGFRMPRNSQVKPQGSVDRRGKNAPTRLRELPFLAYNARLSLSALAGSASLLPEEPRPFLATLNLTENCQARCVTCNYWRIPKKDLISSDRAVRLIGELEALGFRYLRFLGGEPLLRTDLFDVLSEVDKYQVPRVVLATNGLLLDRFAEAINKSSVTHITVSVDGLGDTCEYMRGTTGYFQTVLGNLQGIEGKRIKLASIATRFLADEIEELMAICRKRGYDYDVCLPSTLLPFADDDQIRLTIEDLWPSPDQAERIITALARFGNASRSNLEGARRYLLNRDFPFRTCVLGYTEIIIRANGDVHPGCYELEPVGNIVESALAPIMRSEATADTVVDMFNLRCSRCLIGWETSRAFERPVANLGYVRRRLRGNRQCGQQLDKADSGG